MAADVAAHLGLFDEVLASDGARNLKGARKAEAIAEAVGDAFDYIGDTAADRAIWARSGRAHVVAASPAHAARLSAGVPVERVFGGAGLSAGAALRALRVHQWSKNLLVFAALLLSHTYTEPDRILAAVVAFLCLGLCASGTYVWNDLLDLADDRRHPTKRARPLASGQLRIQDGIVLSLASVGLGLGIAGAVLGAPIVLALMAYIVLTVSYSTVLKRKLAADVIVLAALYLYRIYLGGMAIGVPVSDWLLAFSIFFFLSLGYAKRMTDLPPEVRGGTEPIAGRAYAPIDVPVITTLGAGAGLCSIIVMALYITDEAVRATYSAPQGLWLICLILLYWLNRMWILTFRGEVDRDPVSFAVRDRTSQICGLLVVAVVILSR